MKRYLVFVLVAFLLEVLLLSFLQDQPALHALVPKQDQALTVSFWLAWPLGLALWLFSGRKRGGRHQKSNAASNKSGSGSSSPKNKKSKRRSGSAAKRSAPNA